MFGCMRKKIPIEESRPSIKKSAKDFPLDYFYPKAEFMPDYPLLRTVYKWKGLPKLFILHFTAGQQDGTAREFFDWMRGYGKNGGLCAYFMNMHGIINQQHHGNMGGYHAGTSFWKGTSQVSSIAGGLEIANGGMLSKHSDGTYRTWFNKVVEDKNRRYVKTSEGYVVSGWFEKMTFAQENALVDFCVWLMQNGVEEIVGHDDVAPSRKNDVGGALSLPLAKFINKKVLPLV